MAVLRRQKHQDPSHLQIRRSTHTTFTEWIATRWLNNKKSNFGKPLNLLSSSANKISLSHNPCSFKHGSCRLLRCRWTTRSCHPGTRDPHAPGHTSGCAIRYQVDGAQEQLPAMERELADAMLVALKHLFNECYRPGSTQSGKLGLKVVKEKFSLSLNLEGRPPASR